VAGERYGGSEGRSKKEAEQRAAAAAWRELSTAGQPEEKPE
jgi:ribonuclease-3